ncbi:hypothetical protein [Nocardioides sp. dk4132]|uniref:hypothetical protein n=1 Tax=Nocardioides sp. dk4132 TaxID=2662433 RepID=UPI001296992E|nr:hypothetical protein [Nocardioides sp. dk4132]
MVALLMTAVLTAVHVERAPNGDVTASFGVGSPTLIALGLIWLPMLLKVFALVGGSFKAAGVEAIVPGVLSEADAIELGVRTRQVTGARDEADRAAAAVELEDSIARLTLPVLSSGEALPDSVLSQLARSYEHLRREMPSGAARTSAMTRIVNEASFRASTAVTDARPKALRLLRSPAEGDRIVGLALTQETGDREAADDVLRLVTESSTAFEMFHALRAVQEIAPALDSEQRARALSILESESADPRSVGISQDAGLSYLLPRTLAILREHE